MNLFDPNQIPGYTEAREREQANRDLSFLNLPIPLCGVVVRQFNLKHLILLGNVDNAFITHTRAPEVSDVAQFLWIVSTEYSLEEKARTKFVRKLKDVKFLPAVKEINEYIDTAFQDAPAGSAATGKTYTANCASLVELMAHEYGWDDETIMEKPVARLFQYLRLIQKRHNPKVILFNKSDQIITQNLRDRMAPLNTGGN